MKEICIISCGARKIWDSGTTTRTVIPAKDAYTGPLFKKNREYAEKFYPERWYILSDKYGLIRVGSLISNYNIPPKAIQNSEIFVRLIDFQAHAIGISRSQKIVTTCGATHSEIIEKVFTHSEILNPVKGMPQGTRMRVLKELVLSGNAGV